MYQSISSNIMKIKEATDTIIRTPEDVKNACFDIADLSQESFHILTLNARNRLIDRHLISLGVINACLVHPREVFRACVYDSAVAFIVFHNHPSGDFTPSFEDIKITKQLIESGRIIDIKLLDSLIIAKQHNEVKCLSLREEGICNFS